MGWLQEYLSNPAITTALWPAFVETLQMVGIASVVTIILGLPLGVALHVTPPAGLAPHRIVNLVLSEIIVNITRAIPYAILMISLIPFTRFLVGTSIGPIAASVSLSIAAIPSSPAWWRHPCATSTPARAMPPWPWGPPGSRPSGRC